MYCRSRARVNTLYAEYCRVDRVQQRRQSTAEYVDVEYCRVDRVLQSRQSTAEQEQYYAAQLPVMSGCWADCVRCSGSGQFSEPVANSELPILK